MTIDRPLSGLTGERVFVAFDTETTGLWALSNRIVEIAAVKFRLDSPQTGEFQSFVNPGRPIPAEVTAIHGITDEMVDQAPNSSAALAAFVDFCGEDTILVAHNAPFDISFVGNELERAGIPYPPNPILDTVDIYRRYCPGMPSYSLLSLAQHLGFASSQEHRGLSDSHLVRQLVQHAFLTFSPLQSRLPLPDLAAVYHMAQWRPEPSPLPSDFADLDRAIQQGRAVEIVYQSTNAVPSARVIRPIQVYQLGQVHYIVAYCERVEAERTFRLDRIISYKLI
jgi:DNA polymerase-3 subunit epsilon